MVIWEVLFFLGVELTRFKASSLVRDISPPDALPKALIVVPVLASVLRVLGLGFRFSRGLGEL